jgi:Ni/Co efflux regulator RcnB
MKLLVAMAVLVAFVAGPVLAQTEAPATDSGSSMSSDQGMTKNTTAKTKKHKKKKSKKSSSSPASSTTTGQ